MYSCIRIWGTNFRSVKWSEYIRILDNSDIRTLTLHICAPYFCPTPNLFSTCNTSFKPRLAPFCINMSSFIFLVHCGRSWTMNVLALSSGTLNYLLGGSGSCFGDLKNTFQVDKSPMHNGQKGFCKSGRVCTCFISSRKWWTYCSSLSWNSRHKICHFFINVSTHCACKLGRYFSDHQRSLGLPLYTCNVIRNPFAHT